MIFVGCNQSKEHIIYNNKGQKIQQGNLKDDKKEGEWIYYDTKGDTLKKEYYDNDTILMSIIFKNNNPINITHYDQGVKNGVFKNFYPDGSLECIGNYSKGKVNGTFKCYYPDGQLKTVANYEYEKPIGEYKQYYPTGKLKEFSENIGNGIHIFYDSIGNIANKVIFKDYKPTDTLLKIDS